ncbi:hypothetical protein NLX86_12375 [Streptomyces sp. A3M-1-3]|uniref:hypothetical protein n=1 Tax=Streptomyces sp. A3M-1-3 TaxID=2962044 RepID=UPI0020B63AD3|nr:hypothetical protein [Streptomyces sp. A3M-1-3]MCP3818876.1 hypothetical protein [Streptomyces sp. A3M-1-3]
MPDRRRRTTLRLPLSDTFDAERGSSMLLRDRQSPTPPSAPEGDDNPFAPPPEGRPDQPWQPRRPANGEGERDGEEGGEGRDGDDSRPSPWGGRWSSRQPGREGGEFGRRPRGGGQDEGQGGPGGGLRWDPTDPAQRRARYALLSGMWAFFFALFGQPEIGLMLGALALYWGISSLRAEPRVPDPTAQAPAPTAASGSGGKPQKTAAVSGLVTASLALLIVAGTFTTQIVYRDFYACTNDALTKSSQLKCNDMLPPLVEKMIGVKE